MTYDYRATFDQRANDYHVAMRRYPDSRRREFGALFDGVMPQAGATVFDIPAGGGYLAPCLPEAVQLHSFDFSDGFLRAGERIGRLDATAPVWPIGQAAHVVSLAGLHHFPDPHAVVARLLGHVRPGGCLHVADVALGSPEADFLNGFVDRANPQGHQGVFLSPARAHWPQAWNITRLQRQQVDWRFPDVAAMLTFCRLLFGIVDASAEQLRQALSDTIGYTLDECGCRLHWSLLYLDVQAA